MDPTGVFLPPQDRNTRLMERRNNTYGDLFSGSAVSHPEDPVIASSTRFYPVINSQPADPVTVSTTRFYPVINSQPVDPVIASSTRFYPVINSLESYQHTVYRVIDYNDTEHCQQLLYETERATNPKLVDTWFYREEELNPIRRQHLYEKRSVKELKKTATRKVKTKDSLTVNIVKKEEWKLEIDAAEKIVEVQQESASDDENAYADLGPEHFAMEEDVLLDDEELRRELDIFMSNLRVNEQL